MTTRRLRLRPRSFNVASESGTVEWEQPDAALLEDGVNASIAMSAGTNAPVLNLIYAHVGDVLYPTYRLIGFEVRVRIACVGDTGIGLGDPQVGIRLLPAEGGAWDSGERVVGIPYAAEPTTSIILGSDTDYWQVADRAQFLRDAVSVGVMLAIDIKPWTSRPAQIAIDSADVFIHVATGDLGDGNVGGAGQLARIQHDRYHLFGQAPTALLAGAIALNTADRQIWAGDANGAPVPMIRYRGNYDSRVRYYREDLIVSGSRLYQALRDVLPAEPWDPDAWQAIG